MRRGQTRAALTTVQDAHRMTLADGSINTRAIPKRNCADCVFARTRRRIAWCEKGVWRDHHWTQVAAIRDARTDLSPATGCLDYDDVGRDGW